MSFSIFGKYISPGRFHCSNSQGNFEITLELFSYQQFEFPVYELSVLTRLFSVAFTENSKSYRNEIITFSLSIADKKRQYPTKTDNQNEVIEANFAPQSGKPKSQRKLIFSIQEKGSILRGKM